MYAVHLQVLEQIKTVIENQNQLVSAASSDSASVAHVSIETLCQVSDFSYPEEERK